MTWITEIGGKPVADLDSMMNAVREVPDETFVLVKMYHAFSRQTRVLSIRWVDRTGFNRIRDTQN